jgi:hypothetical protein
MRYVRRWVWWVALCLVLAGCGSGRPNPAHVLAAQAKSAVHQRQKYAVLVNADSSSHHRRNVAYAYGTLRALGFEAGDIFVLSPRDRRYPTAKATPIYKPFPENFGRVMEHLAGTVRPGDLVVIYGTGHGDSDQGESLLELRHGELFATDLRAEVDRLRGDTVVIMDQCFSGGFIDGFQGTKSRAIVVTTVDRDHMTYCVSFARAFWDSCLHPEAADRNHDGKTTVREAFEIAAKAHHKELDGDPELRANAACQSFNGFEDAVLN